MKKVLYIIGLTSAVFLLSAAEKQQESWTDVALGVGRRALNLLEAGVGAVMRGAQEVVQHPEEPIYIPLKTEISDLQYYFRNEAFSSINTLKDNQKITEDEYKKLSIVFIRLQKHVIQLTQDSAEWFDVGNKYREQVKNYIKGTITQSDFSDYIDEIYKQVVPKTEVDQTALTDALGEY